MAVLFCKLFLIVGASVHACVVCLYAADDGTGAEEARGNHKKHTWRNVLSSWKVVPPFQIIGCFGFSRFICIVMYIGIGYI